MSILRRHRQTTPFVAFFYAIVAAITISVVSAGRAAGPPPVFGDQFETGSLSQWTKHPNSSDQKNVVYAGAWSARATGTGSAPAYLYTTLAAPLSELYYDGRFDLISQSTTMSLLRLRTSTTSPILTIYRRVDSKLAYYNETTGAITLGPTVTAGAWHDLSVHVRLNGASSLIEVWLDGTKIDAFSKTDSLGTSPVGRVYLGDPAGARTFDVAYDNQSLYAGNGPGSTTSVDTTPPTAPSGLGTTATGTSVGLSWNSSTDDVGVTGYELWRDGVKVGTTTGTSYTFSGLVCGTSHTFGVDAVDAAGNTSPRASVTASTRACVDVVAPSVPSGLAMSSAGQSSVSLVWSASTDDVGVAGYDVLRSGSNVASTSATSYTVSGLTCGTSYSFGVDAFDAAGNVSAPASVSTATAACSSGGGGTGGGGVTPAAFYVSPSGSDSNPGTIDRPWQTIKKAMTTLTAGQTAYLRAGVYAEQLGGSCDLGYNKLIWTTSGTALAPVTIAGYPGEEKQVVVQSVVRLAGDWERFKNVVVDKNSAYSSFDNVCDGAPNVQLYGNNDTISGLEVRNAVMSGVYAEGADNAQVLGNWIHDNGTHYNLDHGIYWLSGPNSLIADNIVQDNYANGIKIGPNAQSVLVSENTVVGNGRAGVIVSGDTTYVSNNNTIADNILVNNGNDGLRTYWESAGVGTGNNAYNNLIYGNGGSDLYVSLGGLLTFNTVVLNPGFVDLSAGDFHLEAGSPAVDAGDPRFDGPTDYAGAPRPQGGGPDIGAYER